MHAETLKDLLIEELRDLYNAENQLTKALPKMAKAATDPDLKAGFEEHLEQTKHQLNRLEQVFEQLGVATKGKTCKAMKGLIEEGAELIKSQEDPEVLDAGLICAAQKVEHYEIASYGCVRTYAQVLGETEAAALLQETLDEEAETDKKLTRLSKNINLRATEGAEAASHHSASRR